MGELGADDPSSKVGSTPDALLRVGSFACDDPWIQEQATVPWDIAVQPISRGAYENEIDFLGSPRLILYREHYRIRTRLHGLSPPGMFAFAVPLQCGGNTIGLTPLGLIHLRRYQATQRDLPAADSKTATVKEIAMSKGFYQMGRFAVRYRELFGESPSHALSKPPIERHCRLPLPKELGPL